MYQLLDIAVLIYKDGNTSALEIIKTRFEKNGLDGFDFCGQEQLMEIGGIDGVLKVAEIVGERLTNDKDDYEDSWKIDEFLNRSSRIL